MALKLHLRSHISLCGEGVFQKRAVSGSKTSFCGPMASKVVREPNHNDELWLLRNRFLPSISGPAAAWTAMLHTASTARPLLPAAPQSFQLLRTRQSVHLLIRFLTQLPDLLLLLLGRE